MLYITTIQKTTTRSSSPNQRTSNNDVHIIDAIDIDDATSKLIQYYIDKNTENETYDITILTVNEIIN